MTREIKFRAWDKLSSQMLYSDYTHTAGLEVFFKAVRLNNGKDLSDVMQYTGLKDKNGKEIYEGDIVRGKNLEDFDWVEVVRFLDNGWQPFIEHRAMTEFEIIGNIYENPELLN